MPLPPCLAAALVAVALALTCAAPAAAQSGSDRPGPDATGVLVDPTSPALPDVAAESWLVADLDTGQVLAARDPHGRHAPASMLKMLTAVTLLPLLDGNSVIIPTYDDVNVEGSKVGLAEGVGYPASELFAALLMVSGNDAANALSTAAGGQQATAALMNDEARRLGALDTHAVNPHGLDAEGQLSSAYDLAVIARAGLADARFARQVSTRRASVSAPPGSPRIEIVNKNKLLRDYEGALGVKNGYTRRARASFVGAAERDGRRLVVTLMKAEPKVFDEAEKLLDWGFAAGAAQPVGVLGGGAPGAPAEAVAGISGPGPFAVDTSEPVRDGTGLPVTLAGMGLAAAAVFAVRHRPSASSRAQCPAEGTLSSLSGGPGP
ncbi:MAG: D-alanyl-D-alanine carboxypeptidase family protein [Mycobacteriales bacterium]